MTATTRSRVAELSQHTPAQLITFGILSIACSVVLFLFVAAPALDTFFGAFLRSDVVRDGTQVTFRIAENRSDEQVKTGTLTTWALVEPRAHEAYIQAHKDNPESTQPLHAEYIFKPVIALAPLVIVGGFALAGIITIIGTGLVGFVRQKIDREILNALDKLARSQYGEHTSDEIKQLTRELTNSDTRRLHDLSDSMGVNYSDIELLKGALAWRDSKGLTQIFKTHDALKFYMREYFTERYSNAILGMVYIGAAILIIVIGIRGLKFLPSTDPSVVLGALGLEFMLLLTYAAVLMYGKTEESGSSERGSRLVDGSMNSTDSDTEQLLRAFLAIPRSTTTKDEKS